LDDKSETAQQQGGSPPPGFISKRQKRLMMPAPNRPVKSRWERGNVVVEMALVLPFLLLIVAGTIDIGLLFWEKEVLTNASREGARAGARATINGKPEQTTVTAVKNIVQAYIDNYRLRDVSGAPLTLVTNTNFFYQWDTSSPANLWVELRNIPVKMMMLPNIDKLFGGAISNVVYLNAKTTMTAEWDLSKAPTP
jgi:hypothetical protein